MATVDDGTLWRRAQEGDETAFGVLFERHAASIHSYSFRRTGNWALAEDLTSVTFLECWRHRSRVRLDADEVLPWLYGVARNVTRNGARSRRRHAAALARIPRESGEADFAERAIERVASEQRVRISCPRWSSSRLASWTWSYSSAGRGSRTRRRHSRSRFQRRPFDRGSSARAGAWPARTSPRDVTAPSRCKTKEAHDEAWCPRSPRASAPDGDSRRRALGAPRA